MKRITEENLVIVPPRTFVIGRDADIRVCPHGKLLGAAKAKWKFRSYDDRMIGIELVQNAVRRSKAIKIISAAQNEIMELRQIVGQTGFDIETPEIESVVLIVVEELLPHIHQSKKRSRDPRFVKQTHCRSRQKIADLAVAYQGHV